MPLVSLMRSARLSVVVLLAHGAAALASSLPEEILTWQMPIVQVESRLVLDNKRMKARGVFQVRSWFFQGEEVHAITDTAKPGQRVVIYHNRASNPQLLYWSHGDIPAFGGVIASTATGGPAFSPAVLGSLSPFSILQGVIRDLQAGDDEHQSGRRQAIASSELRPDTGEGTVTLKSFGKEQPLVSGGTFREDSTRVIRLEKGFPALVESSLESHDLTTGERSGPYRQVVTEFREYGGSFRVFRAVFTAPFW